MDLHLSGKRVLITGASQGIGFAIASLFAEEGCSLVLVARNEGRLKDAAAAVSEQFGTVPQIIAADLSAPSAVADVCAQAGSIDILVNNAGAIPPGDLLQIEDGAWRQAWDLKVFGYINLVRKFYPMLKERKGVVGERHRNIGVNVLSQTTSPGSSGNAALIAFYARSGIKFTS